MSAEPLANVVELAPKDETPARKNELRIYHLVQASADLLGGISISADVMGIDRGDLNRALNPKDARYLAVEHVMRFCGRLVLSHPETAYRIGAAFVQPMDALVMPRIQLTAAEQARRYKQMLDAMSPACGIDLAKKALETP